MKVDLHIHSNYSENGSFSVEELVEIFKKDHLDYVALTDHNTMDGVEPLKEALKGSDISIIPATEISVSHEGKNYHILAYGVKETPELKEIFRRVYQVKDKSFNNLVKKVNDLGFNIKYGDIEAYSVIHRKKLPWSSRTFLEYLLAFDKYKDHPILKPYRPGGERSDNPFTNFYWDHFKNENEDYLRGNYPEITEVLKVIHDQDGIAILSHPMMILKDYGDVAKIADLGFDGIEVFSNYHTDRDIEELLKIVKEKNMLFTIGSGIHGKDDLIHMNPLRYHYYMLSIGEEKLNTILAKAE